MLKSFLDRGPQYSKSELEHCPSTAVEPQEWEACSDLGPYLGPAHTQCKAPNCSKRASVWSSRARSEYSATGEDTLPAGQGRGRAPTLVEGTALLWTPPNHPHLSSWLLPVHSQYFHLRLIHIYIYKYAIMNLELTL